MSSEVVSPNKLQYSRDFLLRYSSIQKQEPAITDKISHVVSPSGQTSKQPKRGPKSPTTRTAANTSTDYLYRPNGFAKTPNPRKGGTQIYAIKENTPNQSRSAVESYATPARPVVGALAPRSSARSSGLKSPTTRKTFLPTQNSEYTEDPPSGEVSSASSVATSEAYQMIVHPVPTPDVKVFETPVSSPYPKTPISKKLEKDGITSPSGSRVPHDSTPVSSAASDRIYLSPKSQGATPSLSTPYKSPMTPGGSKYSPSKSPKSPVRPISPLDEQRLAQRQKQIDYGYRTVGYLRYRLLVAKDHRKPEHPRTPKKTQGCSKRSWDGQLKKWRRDLHLWDPDNADAFKALLNSDLVVSIIAANPELAEIVDIVREKMENPTAYDEELEEQDFINATSVPSNNVALAPSQDDVIEKKISPPRIDTNKVQNKVARTLVF